MILHAHGMPGMGDVMMYLNVAHTKAYIKNTHVELIMHWPHGEDFLYHFEDEETIVERMEYIHSFYTDSDRVNVTHIFNDNIDFLEEHRLVSHNRFMDRDNSINDGYLWKDSTCSRFWTLDEKQLLPTTKGKIVIWRPTFNAETPRPWKLVLNHSQWQEVVDYLSSLGYDVVELTYRTPIREALYHCSTCEYAFFYDGMWHMMTTMLFKPSVVVANSSIGTYNTINAVPVRTPSEMRNILGRWSKKDDWVRMKKNGEGGYEPVSRFNASNCTGEEYLLNVNRRMKGRFERALNNNVDWSMYPIFSKEWARKKYLDI